MTRNEQQMAVGTVVCLAPGWDVVRIPAADDRIGRAAIEAMDTILSVMGDEIDHADKLDEIGRCIQTYIGRRWHITQETRK